MHPCGVNAQARGESVQSIQARMAVDPEVEFATKRSDLDAWMPRLLGRYQSPDGRTRIDCTSVGSGPGVECVSHIIRPPATMVDVPDAPDFLLYGVDPDLPGVRRLRVSGQSIADHDEVGRLGSNTVTFQSTCPLPVNRPPTGPTRPPTPIRCEHQIRIFAPPDSDTLLFSNRTDLTVILPPPTRNPIRTFTTHSYSEWQRLADDETSAPVLQLDSVELQSLEQYGKAEIPELVGHVADQAGSLAPEQRAVLESQLAAYEASTSQRIIVATVARLNGLSIEAFLRQAAVTWQLGSEARTAFILVAVAPNDGAARIEAGEAMLACVPDTTAQQILEEAMVPDFTYRRFGEGISMGVAALMAACREWRAATEEP